jgi:large subunit ribosomal protein L28
VKPFFIPKEQGMARVCEICGKGVRAGNSIVRHGMPKKKGGIGLHTTGVNRRRFLPNLQRVRINENGGIVRRRVCAECIKAGKVVKA